MDVLKGLLMFGFLKKQKIEEKPAENVIEDKEEDAGISWLDLWEQLGKKVRSDNNRSVDDVIKEMLPRGPHNLHRKGSNVALDAGVKPATYYNDLPQFMVPFFDH